jgi:uncharacterized protein (DUF58 family)
LRRPLKLAFTRYRTLTLMLILGVIAVVFGLASGFWLLYRLAYVIAFALIVALVWSFLNLRGLRVWAERKTERAQVGQDAEERIFIQNTSIIPKSWVEIEDPSDMPGHHARQVVTLGGRRKNSWPISTPLLRRGVYTWGPVSLKTGDPFGIFKFTRRFGPPSTLLVYPPVVDLPHFQAPAANLPGEGRFRKRTHYVTPNASGVRQYVPGDGFNRIHWKSTARTGELMVKTFELDPASDLWIILDMEGRVNVGSGDESTEEYGVKIAASIARLFLLQNRSVGLMTFGEDLEIIEPERGQQQLSRILEALAVVRATGDVPLSALLNEEQRRFGRHTTLVVVTPSTDEPWVVALQALHQRGVRAAVTLMEATTFGVAPSSIMTFGQLTASEILTYMVRRGDNLTTALSPSQGTVVA